MDIVLTLMITVGTVALCVWLRKHQRSVSRSRPDPVLQRARSRARRPARMMLTPPAGLGSHLDDRQCRQIGVALAERRLDDAVALWSDATNDDHQAALRAMDSWMADGTRVSLDPTSRPAAPAGQPTRAVDVAPDSPWPTMPSRNTEPGSANNEWRW